MYDRYAASARKQRGWRADNPGNAAIRDELAATAFSLAGSELAAADAILDVGCGSAWWLERLARDDRVHATLSGVELLPERAEAARTRVPTAVIGSADARSLPFPDGAFGAVTLFTVLSSMASDADVTCALCEARRVLAPRGVLLVWEPRVPNPLNRTTGFVGQRKVRLALRAGDTVQTRTTTVLPPLARRLGRYTGRLYPLLGAVPPLRTHTLLCATASSL